MSKKTEAFLKNCNKLSDKISENESGLIKLLAEYETYDTARDEITRSTETLLGMKNEIIKIVNPLDDLIISTFFPLNLPLYSLILFGVAPSAFSSKVFIRPPEVMNTILKKIWNYLSVEENFPNLSLEEKPRNIFVQLYATESDVIIFTGKYDNALDVHEHCPASLLLYNGSGINPFIIFKNANIDLSVAKSVEMRCFNSGQDCAGPDAFFIPSAKADEFSEKLETAIKKLLIGNTKNQNTDIGPTIKESYIKELEALLIDEKENITFGGNIDIKNRLVYPTIIKKNIRDIKTENFHEFFAPVFYLLVYENLNELKKLLKSRNFKDRAMYISVFGDNKKTEDSLDFVKVLKNKIVNDVEHGNQEYGGYGRRSNFLMINDQLIVKPILISRDINQMLS
jgi:acyl-CoA reductase-like NAD-dependent aldehyde dehydrogenase